MRIDQARTLAEEHSKGDEERFWRIQKVVDLANNLAETIITGQQDGETLIKAAWLHDIGRSFALLKTGLYFLDGAMFLEEMGEIKLAQLVANCSFSKEEAEIVGLGLELERFPYHKSLVSDCLSYCDLSIDDRGKRVMLSDKVASIKERYKDNSSTYLALTKALPRMKEVFLEVETLVRREASL